MAYVYRFKHYRTNEIIYIGKTNRKLEYRMREHFKTNPHLPARCYSKVGKIEYIQVASDCDAIFIEQYLINKYKPNFNKVGKSKDCYGIRSKLIGDTICFRRWKVYEIRRTSIFNLRFLVLFKYIEKRYDKFDSVSDFFVEIIFYVLITYFIIITIINM